MSGVEVAGSVQYHDVDYYFFRPRQYNAEAYEDTRLLVTVLQGDVDIYISASWETRPRVSYSGAVTSFLASSTSTGSEDMLLQHDWIDHHCAMRTSCYFIVAAVGTYSSSGVDTPTSSAPGSSYTMLMSNPDSTVTLINGVPRRSHVDSGRIEYFKYSLTQQDLDLEVSVTPLSGDPGTSCQPISQPALCDAAPTSSSSPFGVLIIHSSMCFSPLALLADLYISLEPVTRPDQRNYTWHQSKFGADTLTLQYSDIAKHCVPDPTRAGGECDFFVGVFGWQNSTFTILAAAKEGFRSPITLLDLAPQSGAVLTGEYAYYKYLINVASGGDALPVDVKFTLTPTGGGPSFSSFNY